MKAEMQYQGSSSKFVIYSFDIILRRSSIVAPVRHNNVSYNPARFVLVLTAITGLLCFSDVRDLETKIGFSF